LLVGCAWLAGAQQQPQFTSRVERIVIDVQVVDNQGRPVEPLTAEDFDVRIGGHVRKVASVEFIRAAHIDTLAGGATPGAKAGAPAAAAMSDTAIEGDGRDFILAIDEASFRLQDAQSVIRAARGFVDHLAVNDRVGLFTYPASPRYFALTPDHLAVSLEIGRVVGSFTPPPNRYHLSLSDIVDIEAGDRDLVARIARRECLPAFQTDCIMGIPADANAIAAAYESETSVSMQALRQLFAALHQDRHRKTVVIVSGGIFSADRIGGRPDINDVVDRLAGDAAAAGANLYVLFADASFLYAFSAANGERARYAATEGPSARDSNASLLREQGTLALGLERLAGGAGGALLKVESGQEERAFQRILRETSAYYLLGVEPVDEDRDGRLHPISVKTNVSGAEVRARKSVRIPRG
jgi:VWFA-related protein